MSIWNWFEIIEAVLSMIINSVATGWTVYTVWKVGVQGYDLKFVKLEEEETQ